MPLPAVEQYARISKAISQDESHFTESMIERYGDQISEFKIYVSKVDPLLKSLDSDLNSMIANHKRSLAAYADMANVLEAYEEMNLQQYVDVDVYQLVLNNPDNEDIKNRLRQLSEDLVSPFVDLQLWARGELYDLESMLAAINLQETIVKKAAPLKKKATKTASDVELQQLDKGQGDKAEATDEKEARREEEREYQVKLTNLLTVHLGSKVTE